MKIAHGVQKTKLKSMLNKLRPANFFLLMCLLSLVGCTSIPEKESGSFHLEKSKFETSKLIWQLANKCWYEKSNIPVNIQSMEDKDAITAGGGDFFFIAVVSGDDKKSSITTHEGNYACGLGCWSLNLTDDIKRWSNGDLSCRSKSLNLNGDL